MDNEQYLNEVQKALVHLGRRDSPYRLRGLPV